MNKYDSSLQVIRLVQERILEKKSKNNTIQPEQIELFFNMPKINEVFLSTLDMATNLEILPLDDSLMYIAKNLNIYDNIYSLAIVLNNGANPNCYVNPNGHIESGPNDNYVHILAYIHSIYPEGQDENLLNIITSLFIYKGANLQAPLYKKDIESKGMNASNQTVLKWLCNNSNEEMVKKLYNGIDKNDSLYYKNRKILAILTGDINLISENLKEDDIELLFKSRALGEDPEETIRVVSRSISKINGMDYNVMLQAVKWGIFEAVEYYTKLGIMLSYPLINNVILLINNYNKNKFVYSVDLMSQILQTQVSNGLQIDTYQNALLTSASKYEHSVISKLYEKPYWKKICNEKYQGVKSTKRLENLAINLDIDSPENLTGVCSQLKSLAGLEPERALEILRMKNEARFDCKHKKIADYIGDFDGHQDAKLKCDHKSLIDGDPNLYINSDTISYRDEYEKIWCFPSSYYESMKETGLNPITSQKLPKSFLEELDERIKYMKKHSIDVSKPTKYNTILPSLTKNDDNAIASSASKHQLKNLMKKMSNMGFVIVDEDWDTITKEDLQLAMSDLYKTAILDKLVSNKHALVTTAYIVNYFYKSNKNVAQIIMENIYTMYRRRSELTESKNKE